MLRPPYILSCVAGMQKILSHHEMLGIKKDQDSAWLLLVAVVVGVRGPSMQNIFPTPTALGQEVLLCPCLGRVITGLNFKAC